MTKNAAKRPKMAPEAPTTCVPGLSHATARSPPSPPGSTNATKRHVPRMFSSIRPKIHTAHMLNRMWKNDECTNSPVINRQGCVPTRGV